MFCIFFPGSVSAQDDCEAAQRGFVEAIFLMLADGL
jgi:hypothetical protein